jgi:hypothetical protein
MNKSKFLSFLLFLFSFYLFPVTLSAQLDRIKPGMTLAEVKHNFPGLKPNASAMSSWVYSKDSVEGIKGSSEYVISKDTELRYGFTSNIVSGPCKAYPDLKSENYSHLMKAAVSIHSSYTSLYGPPAEYKVQPELADDSSQMPVNVFYAKWKHGANELSVTVSRPGKNKRPEINGPPPSTEDLKPGCKYTLEIVSIGTGNTYQKSCGNGITGQTFKELHPGLAAQVENHPDSWVADDTISSKYGDIEFTFEGKRLDSYSIDITDGPSYSHKSDTAYSILSKRAIELYNQAKKIHGKPDTLINKVFATYPGKRSRIYHRTTYFAAEWKIEDKKLYIIFDESSGGKQFEPIFHITVFYGRPVME